MPSAPLTTAPPADAIERNETSVLTSRIIASLERQPAVPPVDVSQDAWNYAVRYSKQRYDLGLDHYRRLFRELGWSGKRHGLDIGSGAGHWTIAFALDNDRATGIEKGPEFVHLANGAAEEAGLAGKVRHQVGLAEALDFRDCSFDAVWSHGVLQFCDSAASIAEIARVLEPGGLFYCGYSSMGFRLAAIYRAGLKTLREQLKAQLRHYLSITLRHDGLSSAFGSAYCAPTAEEFAALCRAFGLTILQRPGLQDNPEEFAGVRGTIDFLCARDGDPAAFRAELLDLPAGSDEARVRLRALLRLGLGTFVQDILEARGEPLGNPDIRSLYVLAAVRAGRAETVSALAETGLDPLVRGLLSWDRRRKTAAIAAFRSLPSDHPDRSFLLGAALLDAGDKKAATIEFERGADAKHRPVECEFGAMLARLVEAEWPELRDRMVRALRILPDEFGASVEEIDRLAAELARTIKS